MVRKDERWLDQTGLNLIRIVIGSYFMAVSLDLVVGLDQKVLFLPFMPPNLADLIGSTLLFIASVAFMTGIYLRTMALVLALFVLCSSLLQNFLISEFENISDFWRDVTLACAVILNYSNLGRRELRRASVVGRRAHRVRKITPPLEDVAPRRICPSKDATRAKLPDIRETLKSRARQATLPEKSRRSDDEIGENLFANV